MTTDDRLLLTDLERIERDLRIALELQQYGDFEYGKERVRVDAFDLGRALTSLARAQREMVDFRERLERRLK